MIGVAVAAIAAVGLLLLPPAPPGPDEILLRPYPAGRWPWNRAHTLRVRLDLDHLRTLGLSKEDVLEAMTPSSIIGTFPPDPPPGVVYTFPISRPDQWGNIILRANPDGEILRLKDVAKVEVDW
jgi:hypothetical protein